MLQEKVGKLETELARFKTKFAKLESSSNGAIKALEGDKKDLNVKIDGLAKDLNTALKEGTQLRVEMTKMRADQNDALNDLKGNFEFTIEEQKDQIETLQESEAALEEELKINKEIGTVTSDQLKELRVKHTAVVEELEEVKQELKVKSQQLDEETTKAEGAIDQLEETRKEIDDLVDQKVSEKEMEFQQNE